MVKLADLDDHLGHDRIPPEHHRTRGPPMRLWAAGHRAVAPVGGQIVTRCITGYGPLATVTPKGQVAIEVASRVLAEDSYLIREALRGLLGAAPELEVVAVCEDIPELFVHVSAFLIQLMSFLDHCP